MWKLSAQPPAPMAPALAPQQKLTTPAARGSVTFDESTASTSSSDYSYSGSYSYSYSYSQSGSDSSTGTEPELEAIASPTAPPVEAAKMPPLPSLPPCVPQRQVMYPVAPQGNQPRPTAAANVKAVDVGSVSSKSQSGRDGDSYSHSYSYSDEDSEKDTESGSYSYSYSYSGTKSTEVGEKGKSKHGPLEPSESSYYYSYSRSSRRGETSVSDATGDTSSYTGSGSSDSYSYSYSTDGRSAAGKTSKGTEGITVSTTGTMEDGTGDRKRYTESDESGSYSYSYSYSGTQSISGSPSQGYTSSLAGGPKERVSVSGTRTGSLSSDSTDIKLKKVHHSETHSRRGSEITSSSIATNSLIKSSSGSDEISVLRKSEDGMDDGMSSTHTTRKEMYSYDGEVSNVSDLTQKIQTREVILLSVPTEEAPQLHALPNTCWVPRGSGNDTLSRLLDRLMEVQVDSLRRKEEKAAISTEINSKKEKGKNKKNKNLNLDQQEEGSKEKADMEVPPNYFIKKSLKFALKAVGVQSSEERALILKGLDQMLPRSTVLSLLDNYAEKNLLRRMMSMFRAYDKFRSGEVPLGLTLKLLGRCGVAHRSIGNITLSICTASAKGCVPLLCVSQRMPLPGPLIATVEGEVPSPLETQINEEVVDVCRSEVHTGGSKVYLDESKGNIYVGNRRVITMLTPLDVAKNVVVQMEALIHVCFLIDAYVVNDPLLSTVLYAPLLTSLLSPSATKKTSDNGVAFDPKSILVENALVSVLNPEKKLESLSACSRLQGQYFVEGSEDAVLCDALQERQKNIEHTLVQEVCRNIDWAPNPLSNGLGFETPNPKISSRMCYEIYLKKMYLSEATHEGARCYCLLSVRRALSNTWMPAITVSIESVKASKKNGFKWTFSRDQNYRVLFMGVPGDTICIEACYDMEDNNTGELVTWCVGHVLVKCSNAKTEKLSVLHGNILSDVAPPPATPAKLVSPSKSFFCFSRRKKNATPATFLSIVVSSVPPKSLPPQNSLPPSFLAFRRHIPMMSQLRDAMMSIGGSGMNPLNVIRHQQVQHCLSVISNPMLMDVLQVLWDRTLNGKMGAKPKDTSQRRKAVLALVTKMMAVHNSISGNQEIITGVLGRGEAIPVPTNLLAPQRPVYV